MLVTGTKFWVILTLKMILVFTGCLGLFYYVMERFWNPW